MNGSVEIPSMDVDEARAEVAGGGAASATRAAAKAEPARKAKAAAGLAWTTSRIQAERERIAAERAALIQQYFGGAPRGVEALAKATRDGRRDAHVAGAIEAAHRLADLQGALTALIKAHRQASRRELQAEAAAIREARQHADAAADMLPGLTDARRRKIRNAITRCLESEATTIDARTRRHVEPAWSADGLNLADEATWPREAKLAIGETRRHWLRVLAAAQQHV